MVKILRFWGYSLACAWRGSFSLANAWQGLWGTILLWGFGYWRKIPVTIPDKVDNYALVFLFASLSATWIGVFLFQFLLAPAKLYQEQRERAEKLNQDLRTVTSQNEPKDQGPDWPIDEVFFHLEPDVLNPAHKRWEKVADELRDALSLGKLRAWGRLYKTDLGIWVGERASLRPIEKTYWYKAFFTYLFFSDQTEGVAAHCYADRSEGVPAYTDLQFNRSEVQNLWPRELGAFVENYPNVRVADNPSIHESILGGPDRQKFLSLLAADKLSAWGRPMFGSSDFVKIPANAWDTHKIDVSLHSGDSIGTDGVHRVHHQSYLRSKSKREATHYDVALNRAQMRMVWPDLAFTLDDGSGA